MFTFSFPNPDNVRNTAETGDDNFEPALYSKVPTTERIDLSSSPCKFPLSSEVLQSLDSIFFRGRKVVFLPADAALKILETHSPSSNVYSAEAVHSDLIPGKYEGGLKVWECTLDLLDWLSENVQAVNLSGKRVLDLGCGSGLLGIAALQQEASVVFQDYNREVIEAFTIPNVLCNLSEQLHNAEACKSRCEFYCGDWSTFSTAIVNSEEENAKFDLILTSETIYNPDNHKKLANVFRRCLKKNGVAYLAAKTYYFGVGGSLRAFQALLETDGQMKSEVAWKCSKGVQREIIKITFL